MAYGWEGEKVRLAPLDKQRHLENVVRWLNDPETTERTLVGDFPLGRLAEEEWFDLRCKPSETDIVFAVETLAGEHIGLSGIHRIDFRHGVGHTGTLICSGKRRQGFGIDSIRVRSDYCFRVLNLRLLLSEVLDGNEASYRALTRAGYRDVGRIPQRYWKRGAYRDAILLAYPRDAGG